MKGRLVTIVCVLLLAACTSPETPEPRPAPRPEIAVTAPPPHPRWEELLASGVVEGDGLGFSGDGRGLFHEVACDLYASQPESFFRGLLDHENPVARVMGLYGLARMYGLAARRFLEPFLRDRDLLAGYWPHGCVAHGGTTVGRVAFDLIVNPEVFENGGRVLDDRARLKLAAELLADDRCEFLRGELVDALDFMDDDEDGDGVRHFVRPPGVSELTFYRAVCGNATYEATETDLVALLGRVRDHRLPPEVRLTIASSLSRREASRVAPVLRELRDELDRLEEGAGTRILRDFEERAEHEYVDYRVGLSELRGLVDRGCPAVLVTLQDDVLRGDPDPLVRRALERVAVRVREPLPRWHADAAAKWTVDRLLAIDALHASTEPTEDFERIEPFLDAPTRDRLRAKLAPALR